MLALQLYCKNYEFFFFFSYQLKMTVDITSRNPPFIKCHVQSTTYVCSGMSCPIYNPCLLRNVMSNLQPMSAQECHVQSTTYV